MPLRSNLPDTPQTPFGFIHRERPGPYQDRAAFTKKALDPRRSYGVSFDAASSADASASVGCGLSESIFA